MRAKLEVFLFQGKDNESKKIPENQNFLKFNFECAYQIQDDWMKILKSVRDRRMDKVASNS